MEIIKYICEFFFTNFWHWLGLFFVLAVIFGGGYTKLIEINHKKDEDK